MLSGALGHGRGLHRLTLARYRLLTHGLLTHRLLTAQIFTNHVLLALCGLRHGLATVFRRLLGVHGSLGMSRLLVLDRLLGMSRLLGVDRPLCFDGVALLDGCRPVSTSAGTVGRNVRVEPVRGAKL